MSNVLPDLPLLAVGGTVAPTLLLLLVLFPGFRRPLTSAGALMLGYSTVYAVMGILVLVLSGEAGRAIPTVGRVICVAVVVVATLYAAAPRRALQAWMRKCSRTITEVVRFVFGEFFLVRGLLEA